MGLFIRILLENSNMLHHRLECKSYQLNMWKSHNSEILKYSHSCFQPWHFNQWSVCVLWRMDVLQVKVSSSQDFIDSRMHTTGKSSLSCFFLLTTCPSWFLKPTGFMFENPAWPLEACYITWCIFAWSLTVNNLTVLSKIVLCSYLVLFWRELKEKINHLKFVIY